MYVYIYIYTYIYIHIYIHVTYLNVYDSHECILQALIFKWIDTWIPPVGPSLDLTEDSDVQGIGR